MQPHFKHIVVLPSGPRGFIFVFLSVKYVFVYFSLMTIKTGITSVWRAAIIYLIGVCLLIFCIGNYIYFILHHDGWSIGRWSIRRLCVIFCNCPDMDNLLIVALTKLSFSQVRLALFNAVKASTCSNRRI